MTNTKGRLAYWNIYTIGTYHFIAEEILQKHRSFEMKICACDKQNQLNQGPNHYHLRVKIIDKLERFLVENKEINKIY